MQPLDEALTGEDDGPLEAYSAAAGRAFEDGGTAPAYEAVDTLGTLLLREFAEAAQARQETEQRWLQDLRQYRGRYDPEVLKRIDANRSRAFVRKTRVKVKTTNSRVGDLLFPAGVEKNWDLKATPRPSLSEDQRAEILQQVAATLPPGQKPAREQLDQATRQWAAQRAKGMALVCEDQLAEARYKQVSLKAITSGHLYGTGIVKGPLVERKVRTRFVRQGMRWVPQSESFVVPFIDYVPVWRFYPDMAATELEKCRYVFERHLMTRAELAALAQRRRFHRQRIVDHLEANPDGAVEARSYASELVAIGDRDAQTEDRSGQYEVLERWGWLSGAQLREARVEVPDERVHEAFFANVWVLPGGQVIKAALQPINGVTWPYHLYYFDKDETSIFGEGIPAVMRDDQTNLNASVRMMFDNAAITAGAQLEVNPHLLQPNENTTDIVSWRVWHRNNTTPGQPAVRAIELPSRLGELNMLAQMCDANADETTAIPRYVGGSNPTQGAAGTSSGLSMLMGNVNIVIKDLIANWDEGVTEPFVKALYFWNMQFHPDDRIKGDFDAVATGTASLVAKEVRARQLAEFAVMTNNPVDLQLVKRRELLEQIAESNELVGVVKTQEEVDAETNSDAARASQAMQLQLQELQLKELMTKLSKASAEIDALRAKTVATKVEAAYAALQAGGVATQSPFIAPAGDEILRSSGWKDATPVPAIADLDRGPVQQGGEGAASLPAEDLQPAAAAPDLAPQSGMDGRRSGIETPAIGADP